MESIADRIKQAMELRDLRQADVVHLTGIDKGRLSSYLSGKYKPKQDSIYKLANAFRVSESWLLGYDVPIDRFVGYADDELSAMIGRLDSSDVENLKKYITNMLLSQDKYKKESATIA